VYEPQFVGPPGTLYFGRATAFSSELRERSRAFIEAQAACVPDADFAQLTYFVPGRSASFVQFPTLTPVEVTLAARPGLVAGLRIDVNDIVVRVDGDRVVLRSRATGREILLRPAGAANPNHPDVTPMARFLLTCGRRNWAFEFEWGPLAHAPFLPRISFDGHVLSAAIWNLDPKQIRVLREARTVEARFDAVQRLRAEARLPRHILFAEGVDLHLPVDLDDVLSVEAWLDILGERASIREQFPVEESVVAGPEGPNHHELVVPLLLETSTAKADVRKVAPATTPIPSDRREPPPFDEAATFDRVPPGDRCLFLSIYGGRADLIAIVTGTLRNLLVDARDNRDLTHWFFLPYADPDPHLRLRLFGEPQVLFGKLLFAIRAELEPLIASRVVREIRVGTYHRETVRYGGAQVMDLCEKVFWASSEAAVVFHDAFTGDSTEVKDLLPPVVRSLRGVLLLAGLSPAEARAQAALTGELYTRATDPVAPRRMAGALLREHKAALIDKPNPEALFGSELADRFRNALLDVQAACASGGTWPFNRVFADLLHVHSMRLLTAWCAVADLEATAYFTLEKVLAGEVARST
jgi:thiopeptide-type bacteriocin biosynthesis protein